MTPLVPLFSLLMSQVGAGQDLQAAWPAEFYAGASGSHVSQGNNYGGWQGSGTLGATWYLRQPLVDDDTPPALQSYMQRLSQVSLSASGSAFSARDDVSRYRSNGNTFVASSGGVVYVGDLILGLGFSYEHIESVEQSPALRRDLQHTTRYGAGALTLGLRFDKVEVLGTYQNKISTIDGANTPATWGQARVRIRSVVNEIFYSRYDFYTLTDGWGTAADLEFYVDELGFWLAGYLEGGAFYVNSTQKYRRAGGELGWSWWSSHRLGYHTSLGFETSERLGGNFPSMTTGIVSFGIVLRAPERRQPRTEAERGQPDE